MASVVPQDLAKRMKFRQRMQGPYRVGCFGGLGRRKMAWETHALGCGVRAGARRHRARSEREERTRQGDKVRCLKSQKLLLCTKQQPQRLRSIGLPLLSRAAAVSVTTSSASAHLHLHLQLRRVKSKAMAGSAYGKGREVCSEAYSGLSASPSVQQFHF
jgi:hypothetical protein